MKMMMIALAAFVMGSVNSCHVSAAQGLPPVSPADVEFMVTGEMVDLKTQLLQYRQADGMPLSLVAFLKTRDNFVALPLVDTGMVFTFEPVNCNSCTISGPDMYGGNRFTRDRGAVEIDRFDSSLW